MIRFDAENHKYFDETGRELISVTQLLSKHGLSSDFSMVDADVLRAKADRGTMIHQEIEYFIMFGDYGFTAEFADYLNMKTQYELVPSKAEVMVYNDTMAGTLDQWGFDGKNNQFYIGDIKTGEVNINYLRWQLSLYDYLLPDTDAKKPRKLYCFALNDNSKFISIEPIPTEEIERLIECERKGEAYKQEVVIAEDKLAELVQLKYEMDELDTQKKEIENRSNLIIETVKGLMRDKGIKCFENDLIKLTYVAPTTRETIDTKKLKADLPEIAQKYIKTSEVKDSVRITWRNDDNGKA